MLYNISKFLSISAWNVHGIFEKMNNNRMCKLENANFQEQLNSDIIFLSETHACTNDLLQIDNYKCFVNCRSDHTSRLRGGLAVFIKLNIAKGVKLVSKPLNDMMWFKLDRTFFGFEKDLYVCFMYISPANSSYTIRTGMDKLIFDQVEQDIAKYSNYGDVMLMGDLNAHINSNEKDFLENEMNDILDDCLPENYIADNVYINRNTEIEQKTNSYGNQILDLCTSSQLRILNGRTLGDSAGRATFFNFNEASIDDYCICSAALLKSISNFTVGPLHPSLSDHRMVTVRIHSLTSLSPQPDLRQMRKPVKWSNAQEEIFKYNLSNSSFKDVFTAIEHIERLQMNNPNLNNISVSPQGEVVTSVDQLIQDFSDSLTKATGHFKNHNPTAAVKKKKRSRKKTWYDRDCDVSYRHVKSLSRQLSKTPWDRSLRMKVAYEHKQYKRLVRKMHRIYKKISCSMDYLMQNVEIQQNSGKPWISLMINVNQIQDPALLQTNGHRIFRSS